MGNRRTRDIIQDDRLRSADGAYQALREILRRCDKAGGARCAFAAGDPVRNFEVLARRLRAEPAVLEDPELGPITVTYADLIGAVLGYLYDPTGYEAIVGLAQDLWVVTEPPAGTSADRLAAARRAVIDRIRQAREEQRAGRDFPYDNGFETYLGVACTDGQHPRDAALWPALTAASDRRAPYFGRAWAWGTAPCARDTWTVRDEDAYTGPFNRRTAAPVLFVGNYWDPATNYADAVSSDRLVPNSGLLSSDNWGHTAYGTSACATGAVDTYLLRGVLPARGTVCTGDVQPFAAPASLRAAGVRTTRPSTVPAEAAATSADGAKELPPVATPRPSSVFLGS